ncbi:hypothetical protein KNN17_20945 [Arthrobacter bambusae]|uniref:hypothetical protein n=1 Tax=Arthrobacter TaxID=1663 RepID=UPI001F51554A|nr:MULTISPECIES: hypothetical protein [Arthrobacter]MCI0144031.1 hypothetical protein [Arthrobacter bambusae]UYY83561.1 hypothetical protein OIT41_20120 [Arthrobacter sp. YA7-1]
MDAVDAVKVAGVVIAALGVMATSFWKVFENDQEIRAHSFAIRAFALAKTIGEQYEQGDLSGRVVQEEEAAALRVRLLDSGNKATERYLDLLQSRLRKVPWGKRKIHWVDALMYASIFVLLGGAVWNIPNVIHNLGSTWEVTLLFLGWSFVLLGVGMAGVVISVVVQRWVGKHKDAPTEDLLEEFERSRSGAS